MRRNPFCGARGLYQVLRVRFRIEAADAIAARVLRSLLRSKHHKRNAGPRQALDHRLELGIKGADNFLAGVDVDGNVIKRLPDAFARFVVKDLDLAWPAAAADNLSR